jgi:hypothetical protein
MSSSRPWLESFSWDIVTTLNRGLCEAKNALHKPTSDGHEDTKALWDSNHLKEMTLADAADLCRRCHRMAPFCFYNGNTFAAIMTLVVKRLALPADQAFIVRSLAGHIVSGVATNEEMKAFQTFSDSLE